MQNQIRADMLKVKRMVSEVEMIIGKREGETELVNKLIDAENLLTYCMSRLENAFVPPCKVGDTVYRISTEYYSKRKYIKETKISRIAIDDNGIRVFCANTPNVSNIWGNTVFFTKEQAETKLKESEE